MNDLIDVVLKQDISIEEKFRVYEIKILALQAAGDNHTSLRLGIDVRRQLGFYSPPNKPASKLSILLGFIKTRRLLGNRTPEELANLPKLTNRRVIMAQRMLELVGLDCYTVQPTLFPLIVFLNIKETLKYGINPGTTCQALSGYGVLLCGVFGDPQRGRDMAFASELILAKANQSVKASLIPRCTFICQGCIIHWTAPLKETLAPLLKGYQIGIETGDVLSAGLNLSLLISHTFFAGCPLVRMDDSLSINVGLRNDTTAASDTIQTQLTKYDIHIWHLVVAKLRGIEHEEDETNFDGILKIARDTGNSGLRSFANAAQLELKMLFSDWDSAKDLLQEAGDVRSALVGIFTGVRFTFLVALISMKTVQASTTWWMKWKWKRRGVRATKTIRTWVKGGNVNLVHILHLLDAELAVLNGYDRLAEDGYQLAINTASAKGFLQDVALSHELASSYLNNRGDSFQGGYHMEQAIRYYSEWGATAKVDQLKKRLAA